MIDAAHDSVGAGKRDLAEQMLPSTGKGMVMLTDRHSPSFAPCRKIAGVADVRVMGAVGVVQLEKLNDPKALQRACVEAGIWVRPFRDIVYLTPSFTMDAEDLARVTGALVKVLGA